MVDGDDDDGLEIVDDPIERPLASRYVTRFPETVALPVTLPLASRNVMRSPCRIEEPALRPLESLKSERFDPLAMEECHCWIGNSDEGFEFDCFEVDWPSDCSAPRAVSAMNSVRKVRAIMRTIVSGWREIERIASGKRCLAKASLRQNRQHVGWQVSRRLHTILTDCRERFKPFGLTHRNCYPNRIDFPLLDPFRRLGRSRRGTRSSGVGIGLRQTYGEIARNYPF